MNDYPARTPEEWTEEDLISAANDLLINAKVLWKAAPPWWSAAKDEWYLALVNYLIRISR